MEWVKQLMTLLAGSLILSVGLNGFLAPHGLLEGGALGISLIVHYLTGTQIGFTFFVISLPIFLLAWFTYRPFFHNGIHGMVFSSIVIDSLAIVREAASCVSLSPIANAAAGGILIGIGTGIMLRAGISIGGTDLLAQLIAQRANLNAGVMILLFDSIIVTVGSLAIPEVSILHAMTTVLCVGVTISLVVSNRIVSVPKMSG